MNCWHSQRAFLRWSTVLFYDQFPAACQPHSRITRSAETLIQRAAIVDDRIRSIWTELCRTIFGVAFHRGYSFSSSKSTWACTHLYSNASHDEIRRRRLRQCVSPKSSSAGKKFLTVPAAAAATMMMVVRAEVQREETLN